MYKIGDKIKVLNVDEWDKSNGIKPGDYYEIIEIYTDGDVRVQSGDLGRCTLYADQIEKVENIINLNQQNNINFQTKNQITQHLDKVISMYEEYCNDLLKECSTKYKEDYIDLKETGYEYRLELDKILVEVEDVGYENNTDR